MNQSRRILMVFLLCWAVHLSGCLGFGPINSGTPLTAGVLSTDLANDTLMANVPSGNAEYFSFSLVNTGQSNINISVLKVVEDGGSAFSLYSSHTLPLVLKPGKENAREVVIKCAPTANTALTARLLLESSDAQNTDDRGRFFIRLISRTSP